MLYEVITMCNPVEQTLEKRLSYYYIGQLSRYVKKGGSISGVFIIGSSLGLIISASCTSGAAGISFFSSGIAVNKVDIGFVPATSISPSPIINHFRITSYNVCYTKLLRNSAAPGFSLPLRTGCAVLRLCSSSYETRQLQQKTGTSLPIVADRPAFCSRIP